MKSFINNMKNKFASESYGDVSPYEREQIREKAKLENQRHLYQFARSI